MSVEGLQVQDGAGGKGAECPPSLNHSFCPEPGRFQNSKFAPGLPFQWEDAFKSEKHFIYFGYQIDLIFK